MKMIASKLIIGFGIATLAIATVEPFITRDVTTVILKPAVHPAVDLLDYKNIQANQNATLHYESDPNPRVGSAVTTATISVSSSAYPLVQLEDTAYIQSVTCSSNTAEITFTDQRAFHTAAQDWQSHNQFVIASYNPKCGSGYSTSQRSFVLVKNVTTEPSSMTVKADISFVNYETAVGEHTLASTTFGQHTNSDSSSVKKRTSDSETISWYEYPTNSLTDSQWGPGYQLYSGSDLQLVCVHCGTQGSMTLTGTVNWTSASGIESAEISLSGDMSMTMEVGVDAQGVSDSIPISSMSLAQIPLASIDVPDIMTIGPQLDISASASVTIGATGSMLVGATLNWPSVAATLVLDSPGSSGGSGWSPTFSPVSSVEGSISATLNLDLPVEIGIGVNLLNGAYNKTIGLIDTPSLQLSASASNVGPSCDGVELNAGVSNDVVGDIFGLTTIPVASFSTPLYSTCFGAATSAPPTTTPTPAARAAVGGKPLEKVRGGRRYRQVS